MISLLEKGKLDYAIGLNVPTSSCIKATDIFYDKIQMAISPDHRIAERTSIALEDIINEEFIYTKTPTKLFMS